jgi:hypothetical protein
MQAKKEDDDFRVTSITVQARDRKLVDAAAEIKGMLKYKMLSRWIRKAIEEDPEISHLLSQ